MGDGNNGFASGLSLAMSRHGFDSFSQQYPMHLQTNKTETFKTDWTLVVGELDCPVRDSWEKKCAWCVWGGR